MTTDTIDALWKTVEQFPCFSAPLVFLDDLSQREEQHAVLGRLLDAYLDAGLDNEADAVRRIITACRVGAWQTVLVHFWRHPTGEWRLTGHQYAFDVPVGVYPLRRTPRRTPREVFEELLSASLRDARE